MTTEIFQERKLDRNRKRGASKIPFYIKNYGFFLFSLFSLFCAVYYINPFNEASISDDFAYIWTSRHLYDSGQYVLHPWSSANLMFQAYWGTLFTLINGFSIGTLHISTLALAVIGVLALYLLAQEHNLTRRTSGILTFCLIASPLFLYLTLTFMTDIPALSLLLVSLLFYTRGLKRQSMPYMLAGSVASVAAMYVRPTALALLAGLGIIFWLDKNRLARWRLYLAGSLIPFVSGVVLLLGGTASNFKNGSPNGSGQIKFMTHLDTFIPQVLLWRPGIYLIYLGFFSLPLVIAILIGIFSGKAARLKLRPKVVAFFSVLIFSALIYNSLALHNSLTLPYMGYNLEAFNTLPILGWLSTIIAIPGGIIIGTLAWERIGKLNLWKNLPLEQRFLDTVTLIMGLYHLLFYNQGDRYLFCLFPFTLIVLARYLEPRLEGLRWVVIISCLVVIFFTSAITRFYQDEQAAEWAGSNYVLSLGIPASRISGPWGWYSYYNFDDYLAANPDPSNVYYLFDVWLPERREAADYQVSAYPDQFEEKGWKVIKTIPYSNPFFQEFSVYVLKRPDSPARK